MNQSEELVLYVEYVVKVKNFKNVKTSFLAEENLCLRFVKQDN